MSYTSAARSNTLATAEVAGSLIHALSREPTQASQPGVPNVQEPRQSGDLFPGDALGECRDDADSLNPGPYETAVEEDSSSGFERSDERY